MADMLASLGLGVRDLDSRDFHPVQPVARDCKPPVQQEEEMGSEIKLGDFEDVHALSVSEARAVVTAVHEARKKKDPENNPLRDRIYNDSITITQFLDYLDNFARYKEEDSLHSIAALFDAHPEISVVEKALLGTLTPDTAEEATTLIPSLNMDEEELQLILDELNKMRELEKINKMVTGL
ncbi:unnamed protein product [Alternaria alternata]